MAVQDSNNTNPGINDTKETVHSFKTSEFDASIWQSTDYLTNEVDLVDDDLLLPQSINQVHPFQRLHPQLMFFEA